MKRSIAAKLAAVFLAVALVATAVAMAVGAIVLSDAASRATVAAQRSASQAIQQAVRRQGEALAQSLEQQVADPLAAADFAYMKRLCVDLAGAEDVEHVEIVGADGLRLADGTDAPVLRKIRSASPLPEERVVTTLSNDRLVVSRRIKAGELTLGHLVVTLSLAAAERAKSDLAGTVSIRRRAGETALFRSALWTSLGIAFLAALAALALGRGLTRPIRELRDATRRVGAGDLSVRVSPHGDDEVGELGHSFNKMIDDLLDAREALAEQARVSRELEIAASIQTSLLPPAPKHPGFEFFGCMRTADEVGGDFYDVMADDDGALWLTIGDVSSHGLGAGLVMLMVQAAFGTAFGADASASPDSVLRQVNRLVRDNVVERLGDNKYVTAQLLQHTGKGRFEFAGAHEWPIVVRAKSGRGEVVPLEGPWLGIEKELEDVPVGSLQLDEGDVLVLYSDGIIEARDAQGELFDHERFQATLERELARNKDLGRVADAVLAAVDEFSARQEDDYTLLLVRRKGEEGSMT